ncbi:YceD family protein [Tannerella forsythia]|uniref:DUF177 domain-containing protein n=3 Tax=Tannerella forsythia TaxID=28112 RepID=G8UKZ5_TANFA|nr:DUF177 domain-containing protein [Tannerella forsythia]AEW22558.1 hypothetical protein BFO_0487 [Tannerella forsythia 92A2]OLQ19570.1 hypothetical protein BGK60_01850 [Tannerella forsythia]PDP44953.1 hypothetical protein CLI86_01005 [Tannerella forsythia]
MGKFGAYWVDLRNMNPEEVRRYEYFLDNQFFTDIDGAEVQRGKVNVSLKVERKVSTFEMTFHLSGMVIVSCDRCLDDMEQAIASDNRLMVKFGKEYAEESDEILVISEDEGRVNLAWFLYEFVALNIPMKHVHAPGKCNKAMSARLRKHSAHRSDESDNAEDEVDDDDNILSDEYEDTATDPRWDALKKLKNEE